MGIIKRNFLASFLAITIAALLAADTDAAQLSGPRAPTKSTWSHSQADYGLLARERLSTYGLSERPRSNLSLSGAAVTKEQFLKSKTDAVNLDASRPAWITENRGQNLNWGSVNPDVYRNVRELESRIRLDQADQNPYSEIGK